MAEHSGGAFANHFDTINANHISDDVKPWLHSPAMIVERDKEGTPTAYLYIGGSPDKQKWMYTNKYGIQTSMLEDPSYKYTRFYYNGKLRQSTRGSLHKNGGEYIVGLVEMEANNKRGLSHHSMPMTKAPFYLAYNNDTERKLRGKFYDLSAEDQNIARRANNGLRLDFVGDYMSPDNASKLARLQVDDF